MLTTESPVFLSEICGSADLGDLDPIQALIAPNIGIIPRGCIMSMVAGILTPTIVGNEASAYGILISRDVDTTKLNEDGTVSGAVARNGSFKAAALTCGVGANVLLIAATLRTLGIILEGILIPGLVTNNP
jgi:hypothetical protein